MASASGRHWLDAAGYVDTIGTDNDATIIEERERIWKYRDYVVRAFNADKPMDRFLLEQIAGDELADWRGAAELTPETKELLISTGFLRQAADVTYAPELNTADIRHQVVFDTVQIFSTSVLGLSLHCAQCHTHKFDPLGHADYYKMAAFFAPAYDPQNWKHSKERFLADVSPKQQQEIDAHNAAVDKQVAELQQQVAAAKEPFRLRVFETKLATLPEAVRADTKAALETPAEKRSEVQKYLVEKLGPQVNVAPADVDQALDDAAKQKTAELNGRISGLSSTKRSYDKIQALWDLTGPPPTHLLRRGDYQTPGPPVTAGVPVILDDPRSPFVLPQPAADAATSGYRTALARWLTRGDHPLTGRVFVNRAWQQLFGAGSSPRPTTSALPAPRRRIPSCSIGWLPISPSKAGASSACSGGWWSRVRIGNLRGKGTGNRGQGTGGGSRSGKSLAVADAAAADGVGGGARQHSRGERGARTIVRRAARAAQGQSGCERGDRRHAARPRQPVPPQPVRIQSPQLPPQRAEHVRSADGRAQLHAPAHDGGRAAIPGDAQ